MFVIKASAGGRHSVALDVRGNAYSWGYGRRGRLGHGDGRTQFTPLRVTCEGPPAEAAAAPTGVRLVDVSAGGAHSLFVSASGDAYSCGVGGDGRLGLGSSVRQLRAVHILSLAVAEVRIVACAAGGGVNEGRGQTECGAHSVFLSADGSCWACGCVGNGRLGLRDRVLSRKGYGAFSRTCYSWSSPFGSLNQMIPAQMQAWAPATAITGRPSLPRVRQVVAGERSTLLLCEDGTLLSFGMALRGSKTACTQAVATFTKTWEGATERIEGLDGDLHGVPPHCLVPIPGGQPEEPFAERPTVGDSGAENDASDQEAASQGIAQVFEAVGCLYAAGRDGRMWGKSEVGMGWTTWQPLV